MGCDSKLLSIITMIILVCVGSGVYGYFEVSEKWPSDDPPAYPYLHWYFYHNIPDLPTQQDRIAWYMSYGTDALEGFRWQLVGFMNALAFLNIIFYSYTLKVYVGLGSCFSFLLAFISGALMAGTYTIYYLGVQSYLDASQAEIAEVLVDGDDFHMIPVNISAILGIASDVFNALLFIFMIFGCICGCCKSDEKAAQESHYDYGQSGKTNLAV